jgi:hypothetical protein
MILIIEKFSGTKLFPFATTILQILKEVPEEGNGLIRVEIQI